MKVNGVRTQSKEIAYDGCHKIYLIEDKNDKFEALEFGYDIYSIDELETTYNESCSLRFISNWKLELQLVSQFENAKFEY